MPTGRWRLFGETVLLVIAILMIKAGFQLLHLEWLTVTPLHTGLLAGSIFVLGFLLTGIHTDYKESEKMPVDLTAALESIHQDGIDFSKSNKQFPLAPYRESIQAILRYFPKDSHSQNYRSFEAAKELSNHFFLMERLGMPPNYIVKLKQEQVSVIRVIFRMHYLQKIEPLPSAKLLAESIVVFMLGLLLFTKIGSLADELAVLAFLAFIYIYILKLIRVMDTPFHFQGSTQDDVSLFLLEEQQERMASDHERRH